MIHSCILLHSLHWMVAVVIRRESSVKLLLCLSNLLVRGGGKKRNPCIGFAWIMEHCVKCVLFFQLSSCAKQFQQHLRGFTLRWNLNPVFLWSLVVLLSFGQIKTFIQYLSKPLLRHCVKTFINGYSKYILFLIFGIGNCMNFNYVPF